MMPEKQIVLDHKENIIISTVSKHGNILNQLQALLIGMFNLAEFTREEELAIFNPAVKEASWNINPTTMFLGCIFDWFAISLVSYLRLVKLVHLMEIHGWSVSDLTKKHIGKKVRISGIKYITSVAPEVYIWRNKIAAHRAATSPDETDSFNLLDYSTMCNINYDSPYYTVLSIKIGGDGRGPLGLKPWALTETFERLAPRFWPEWKLAPFHSDEGAEQ